MGHFKAALGQFQGQEIHPEAVHRIRFEFPIFSEATAIDVKNAMRKLKLTMVPHLDRRPPTILARGPKPEPKRLPPSTGTLRARQLTWPLVCNQKATFKFVQWLIVRYRIPDRVLEMIRSYALYSDEDLRITQAPIF